MHWNLYPIRCSSGPDPSSQSGSQTRSEHVVTYLILICKRMAGYLPFPGDIILSNQWQNELSLWRKASQTKQLCLVTFPSGRSAQALSWSKSDISTKIIFCSNAYLACQSAIDTLNVITASHIEWTIFLLRTAVQLLQMHDGVMGSLIRALRATDNFHGCKMACLCIWS